MTTASLHISIRNDDMITCNELIASGYDINAPDEMGMTPLHVATSICNIRMIKLLLRHKACLYCADDGGDTPLHTLVKSEAYKNRKHITRLLGIMRQMIRQGANQYAANNIGITPYNLMRSEDR